MYSVFYSRSPRVSVELNRFPSLEQASQFACALFSSVMGNIFVREFSNGEFKDNCITLNHLKINE